MKEIFTEFFGQLMPCRINLNIVMCPRKAEVLGQLLLAYQKTIIRDLKDTLNLSMSLGVTNFNLLLRKKFHI